MREGSPLARSAHGSRWYKSQVVLLPILLLAIFANCIWPTDQLVPFPAIVFVLGVLLSTFGSFTVLRAKWVFKKYRQPSKPLGQATRLITSDVFNISRNPMYLGAIICMVGLGLLFGNAWLILGSAIAGILLDYFFVSKEEKFLGRKFRGEWQSYASRTRRWL